MTSALDLLTPKFKDIRLETAGGTPTALNFNEEKSYTAKWSLGATETTNSFTIRVRRLGKLCAINFSQVVLTQGLVGNGVDTAITFGPLAGAVKIDSQFHPDDGTVVGHASIGHTAVQPSAVMWIGGDGTVNCYLDQTLSVAYTNAVGASISGYQVGVWTIS